MGKDNIILSKRIIGVITHSIIIIGTFIIVSRLLGNINIFGQYCLFMTSSWYFCLIMGIGLDRVMIQILGPIIEKNKIGSRSEKTLFTFSHFIAKWAISLILMMLVSCITLLSLPDNFSHPIIMGFVFAPCFTVSNIVFSLYSIVNKPVQGRTFLISQNLFFLISLLILIKIIPKYSIVHLSYLLAITFTFIAIIAGGIGLFHLYYQHKQGTLTPSHPIEYNFIEFLLKTKNERPTKQFIKSWLKTGKKLCIGRLSDDLFSLSITILGLCNFSMKGISLATTAAMISGFSTGISLCLRNHFVPKLALIIEKSNDAGTIQSKSSSIIRKTWLVTLTSTFITILSSPLILRLYGPSFSAAFPLVILYCSLLFITNGWSFTRSIATSFDNLEETFIKIQTRRLIGIIILSPMLTYLFSLYGLFVGLALPSMAATLSQLWIIKKKKSINYLAW